MTGPSTSVLTLLIMLAIVVSSAYATGRIHQWYRHGLARDEAYRGGYDKASLSLLASMLAQQAATLHPAQPPQRAHPGSGRRVIPVRQQQSRVPQRTGD